LQLGLISVPAITRHF